METGATSCCAAESSWWTEAVPSGDWKYEATTAARLVLQPVSRWMPGSPWQSEGSHTGTGSAWPRASPHLASYKTRKVLREGGRLGRSSATVFTATKEFTLSGEQSQPKIFEVWEVVEDVCFSLVVCEYKTGMCQVVENLLNICENPRRKEGTKKKVISVSRTDQLMLEQKKVWLPTRIMLHQHTLPVTISS